MGLFFRRERYQEEFVVRKPKTLENIVGKEGITLEDFKEDYEYLSIAKLAYHGVCELKSSIVFRYDEDRVKCLSDVYNGEKVSIYCTEKGFLLLYIDGKLKIKANLEDYLDTYNALCNYKYGIILKCFFYSKIKKDKNEKWIRDIEKSINNYNSFRNNSSVTKNNSSYTKSSSNVARNNSSVVKSSPSNNKSNSNAIKDNSKIDKNNYRYFFKLIEENGFYKELYVLATNGLDACKKLFDIKWTIQEITKNGKFVRVNENRIIEILDLDLHKSYSLKMDEDWTTVYCALFNSEYGEDLKDFFERIISTYMLIVPENDSSYANSSSSVDKSNSSVVKSESNNTEINSNDDKSSSDSPNNDSSFNEKDFNSKLYDLCCEGSKACEELFNLKCTTAVITKNGKFICVNEKRIIEISDSKLKNLFSIKIDDLKTLYSVLINSEYREDLKEFLETNIKKIKK